MFKKLYYMVLDTETATLPFVHDWKLSESEKKKISIAKPIIYDIGWVIMERSGKIISSYNALVAETFSNMTLFDTAYYKEKRPYYLALLHDRKIELATWRDITEKLIEDLQKVDFVGAFNSMFDFKKAIPFTELYINNIYSSNYYLWEKLQKKISKSILNNEKLPKNPDFDSMNFNFRGKNYPLFDIWGMACETLLNNQAYKNLCIDLDMLSESGTFFKTSAEASYRYICNKYNFLEAHTALEDSLIESYLLSKILNKKAVTQGIMYFPFQMLGKTTDFLLKAKKPKKEHYEKVMQKITERIPTYDESSNYRKSLENVLIKLQNKYNIMWP